MISVYHKTSKLDAANMADEIADVIPGLLEDYADITRAKVNSVIQADDTIKGYRRYLIYADVYLRRQQLCYYNNVRLKTRDGLGKETEMTQYYTKNNDGEYNEVEGELLTEEQVGGIVKSRAERIAKQEYADYETFKTKASEADSLRADFEAKLAEANDKVTSLTNKLNDSETEIDKVKLMSEFKLSEDMGEFIIGDTAEERRRRAEKLAKATPQGGIEIQKTNSKKDEESGTNRDLARSLLGGSDD